MFQHSHRRTFLKTVALSAAAPFISRIGRPSASFASIFEPDFAPAVSALRALREGVISSRELTARMYARIRSHNGRVNAFVTLVEEQAMARAGQADEARAAGLSWGPLHGLPIVIKDAFETAGIRTTSGAKDLERHVPKLDADAVARLKASGAIILGKTNLPTYASDLQSYNPVAGTTNNPWNPGRTPGGSTGGGAAAVAAGFGYLELGSDIGGSIRTPCHFCGIYGLKPTLHLVPLRGHIPPPPGETLIPDELPVAGPMARSAADLLLELGALAGPPAEYARAYGLRLPNPRGMRLKDLRVGYVLDDPFCRLGSDVKKVLAAAVDALRKAGVNLVEGWPDGFDPQASFETYFPLLAAVIAPGQPEQEVRNIRASASKGEPYTRLWVEGMDMSHSRWMRLTQNRLLARIVWQSYFRTHDVFLMPANLGPAFPHNHSGGFFDRTVETPEGKRPYADQLRWIMPATLSGCPAAVAPAGMTEQKLPAGIQVMGPFLEDATVIQTAGLLADVLGGYQPPPGFSG